LFSRRKNHQKPRTQGKKVFFIPYDKNNTYNGKIKKIEKKEKITSPKRSE